MGENTKNGPDADNAGAVQIFWGLGDFTYLIATCRSPPGPMCR